MTTPARRSPTGPLQTLLTLGVVGEESDARLLDIYRNRRAGAEEAFRLLVERHGPMVLAVCRSLVADPAEADDAFQAAFLVLVRRAGSIRKGDSLGPWLHGVAVRVAKAAGRRSRTRSARLRLLDPTALDAAAGRTPSRPDASALIHAEIDRLPEQERRPLILCRLEGLTYEQAALALGVPEPTVRGRLHRGRKRLEERLKASGVVAPDSMAPAPLPLGLLNVAKSFAAGAGSTISASHLAKGAIFAMTLSSLKPVAFSSLATLGVVGSVVFAQQGLPRPIDKPDTKAESAPARALTPLQALQKAERSIHEALAKPAGFDIPPEGMSLEALLKKIRETTTVGDKPGIPIYVSPRGLLESKVDISARLIPSRFKSGNTLGSLLRDLLAPLNLDYFVDERAFVTIDSRSGMLEHRMEILERKLDGLIQRLASLAPPRPDIVTTSEESPRGRILGPAEAPKPEVPR